MILERFWTAQSGWEHGLAGFAFLRDFGLQFSCNFACILSWGLEMWPNFFSLQDAPFFIPMTLKLDWVNGPPILSGSTAGCRCFWRDFNRIYLMTFFQNSLFFTKSKKEQSRSLWKVGARVIVFIVVKTCLPKVSLFLEALQLCSPSKAMLEQEVWEERRSQKQTTTRATLFSSLRSEGQQKPHRAWKFSQAPEEQTLKPAGMC